MTIAELMIPELKREAAMTRQLIAMIPPHKLQFTPGHGLHTIGWNAKHLADIVGWVMSTLNHPGLDLGKFDPAKAAAAAASIDVPTVLQTFDKNLAAALETLDGVSDATMDEDWTMSMNGQPLFTIKKGDCLRKWVFTHTAHHRGILSAMLRLAGVEHQSIYEQ